jgi:hypothetical protein
MRRFILLAAALLGGCAAPIGADGLPISLGRVLCAAGPVREPLPAPPPPLYCTRSLGVPDCWSTPSRQPNAPPALADTPTAAPGCG